jgi:RND family efflux transporter MFP subunit
MAIEKELLSSLKINRNQPTHRSNRGWLKSAITVVVLALFGAVSWAFVAKESLVEVEVEKIQVFRGSVASQSVLDATGYIVARRIATVSAKITGRVREILIEEGQYVAAGQVMAMIDPIDAEAQRDLAATQVAAARAMIGSVQAQLKEAEANVLRLDGLLARHLVSKAQHGQGIAQRDSLRAQVAAAQHHAQIAERQLRITEIDVENTLVRAPFSGVVIAKAAQPGEIVSPLSAGGGFTRTGIGTIVDMDSLEIEVDVGEAFIGRVRARMPVEAVLNAYPDLRIPAEVIAIIPTADRAKATVQVRIALTQKDSRIVPDMGVKVRFLDAFPAADSAQHLQGVRVPARAIIKRDGVEVAFVVDDNSIVQQRTLELGVSVGDGWQVLDGVIVGDRVIIDPVPQLQGGTQVRIASLDGAQ